MWNLYVCRTFPSNVSTINSTNLPMNQHGIPSAMELIWKDHICCLPSIIGFAQIFRSTSELQTQRKVRTSDTHEFLGATCVYRYTCNVWVRMHADWRHIIHSKPVGISLFKSFLFVTTWVKQTLVWLQYAGQYTHAQQHASQTYTG